MDHIKILKRAFNITVNYRILWIFGILLALTAGGGGANVGGGGNSSNTGNNGYNGNNPFGQFPAFPQIGPDVINTLIGVAIGLACLILVLIVIGTIVRYVSETAVIRMVNEHENSSEKLTFRQGWHLGWSRAAWKMFLIDLLAGLSFLVVLLAALLVAALPLLVWFTKSLPFEILGSIVAGGLILLVIFAAILVGLALGLVLQFARRVVTLEDLGVIESIRRGFNLVKGRLMDVILMGVMMFGLTLVWSLLMIPVFLAIFLVAAVIAGLPALLVGGIAGLFAQGATPWIIAAVVAGLIFLVVVLIPGSLVGGWQQIFTSSTWTLTYRETLALGKTNGNGEPPAPEAPAAPAAA